MPSYRYPGPRPFEENDINLFFGREKDKKNLLTFISVEQLVVLFSRSGLGKSSLVNAGIIPELRKRNYDIIVSRFNSYINKEHNQNTAATSFSPLQKLLDEIKSKYSLQTSFLDRLAPDNDHFSLWHQFKSLQINNKEKKIYFIFFDQFEELFTYPPEQVKEYKEHLAELLYTSIPQGYLDRIEKLESDPSSEPLTNEQLSLLYEPVPVKLLFTIRSDKFSLLTSLKDGIPAIVTKTYELRSFNTIEATDAIIKPAAIENNNTDDFISNSFAYDKDAIKKMLDYLTEATTEEIESFQLQILCRYVEDMVIEHRNVNDELHLVSADQMGDIKNIFEEYYNKLIDAVDKDKVQNVKRLFEEGLIFEKDKIRVSLYKGQITDTYGIDEQLLKKLVDTHLMRCEPNANGIDQFELSHDSLIDPILKAKEKRMAEEESKILIEKAEKQKIKWRKRVQLYAAIIILIVAISWIYLYKSLEDSKRDKLEINFLVNERGWFHMLDSMQRNDVVRKGFLFLATKDSAKYNTLKYSYNFAALSNLISENNLLLALKFSQKGFIKDSNYVTQKSFNNLIKKYKIHFPPRKFQCRGIINNARVIEDIKTVVVLSSGGIFWYNAATGQLKDSLTSGEYRSDYSVFSGDGSYVVYASFKGSTTYVFNLAKKRNIQIKTAYSDTSSHAIAFDISGDNKYFVVATANNHAKIYSINGDQQSEFNFPKEEVIVELSFSPERKYFASAMSSGAVFLEDLQSSVTKKFPLRMTADTASKRNMHADVINSISFSHDGKFILTGSSDSTVNIWDIEKRSIIQTLKTPAAVLKCRFSDDDNHILLGENTDGTIIWWTKEKDDGNKNNASDVSLKSGNVKFKKDTLQMIGLNPRITSVYFYDNDQKVIASSETEVSLWNLKDSVLPVISRVVNAQVIPRLKFSEQLPWIRTTSQDIIEISGKKEALEGIKTLNDSLNNLSKNEGITNKNMQTYSEFTDLMLGLFEHLENCKEDKFDKLDSFNLYIYTGNAYTFKNMLCENLMQGRFCANYCDKLIEFRQKPFPLDTLYYDCFHNLFGAYKIPIFYYFKKAQYDSLEYWNTKILKDNPQLPDSRDIKNDLTLVYQYDACFRILNSDFDGAKKVIENWPAALRDMSYEMTRILVEMVTVSEYHFSINKGNIIVKKYKKMDGLADLIVVVERLIDEKYTRRLSATTIDNLNGFDDYLYTLNQDIK